MFFGVLITPGVLYTFYSICGGDYPEYLRVYEAARVIKPVRHGPKKQNCLRASGALQGSNSKGTAGTTTLGQQGADCLMRFAARCIKQWVLAAIRLTCAIKGALWRGVAFIGFPHSRINFCKLSPATRCTVTGGV